MARHCRSTQTHYSDSELNSLCSCSLILEITVLVNPHLVLTPDILLDLSMTVSC